MSNLKFGKTYELKCYGHCECRGLVRNGKAWAFETPKQEIIYIEAKALKNYLAKAKGGTE